MRRGGSCPACGSNRCQFYCAACINKATFDGDGQPPLQALRQQRDELLQRLHQQLADRASAQQQQMRRWQLQQELTAAQAQAQRAADALAKAQQQLRQLSAANSSRRHTLDALQQHTASARTEVLGHTLPMVLRYQALTLSHVSAMLAREQRSRLRELCEVFPLRINAVGERGPIQITVCNVRLPDGGSTPPGGWPEPTATNAALGNLLLFVDKVGLIMGGPLLHEAACMASTSSLWVPGSFWSRGPPSANAVLPLHVTAAGAGGGQGAGQAAYSSAPGGRYLWGLQRADSGGMAPGGATAASIAAGTVAAAAGAAAAAAAAFASSFATGADAAGGLPAPHPGLSSSGSSPRPGSSAALLSAAAAAAAAGGAATPSSSSSSASAAASPPPSGRSSSSRREPDFKAAWDLLQRSLACFLKDKAARNGMQLPSAWNPLAWLVVYCAVVKRDSRQDGRLVAVASNRSIGDYAAAIGAATAAAGGGGGGGGPAAAAGGHGSMAGSSALDCFGRLASAVAGESGGGASTWPGHAAEEEEEEEEDEGWGVVKTILPPPPSQPDQVEHWARAMYADGNALAGNHGPAAAAASSSSNPASSSSQQQAGVYGLVGLPRGLAGVGGAGAAAGLGGGLGSSPGGAGGMLPVERIRSLFGK